MAGFSFIVSDVFPPLRGWTGGLFVVGPPTDTSSGLNVGDNMNILTQDGERQARCLGFPLLNLDPDRSGWVCVHLDLPEDVRVRLGALASKV